jgi:hypothetical protein
MATINVKQFSRKASVTPQTEPVPGKNHGREQRWWIRLPDHPWDQMRRYLILGAEGGTYYVKEQDLLKQSYTNVLACIKE